MQLRSGVLLVNVVATVVDGKGRTVPDLTADDFIIEEDGQPQTIQHLLPSADLPISIGVIIDTSLSMESKIRTAQRAVDRFLSVIHKDDEVFLMTFARGPSLIADFTSDRTRLTNALLTGVNLSGGTSLYDSLYQALQKVQQGRYQKKAVLLVTDGEDTTSATRFDKALQYIREAEMLVYSIGIRGAPSFDMGIDVASGTSGSRNNTTVDMKVLNQFGEASGGRAWEISEAAFGKNMDAVLDTIAAELRSQYSIGYTPNRPMKDGKWHSVRIRMRNPEYLARGRKEYLDTKVTTPTSPAAQPAGRYAGRSLADVLRDLQSRGLKVVFSSELVRPEMRVTSEPASTTPRKILDEVLEPHGLRAVAGPKDTWLVVRAPQNQKAAVEGVARAEESGAAVQFALVRLVRADSSPLPSDSPPQGITNADGRYRFDGVAPGRYRVQLLRIGFRPLLTDPVQVAAGETVRLDLRVASQPLVLPPVTVTAEVCVSAKNLKEHPQLQTLWQQARDGASVRTELMARFRYHVLNHEESYELKADGPTAPGTLDRPYVSDPQSAVKNAARNRDLRLARGYYGPHNAFGDGFYVPNELDVLHEDFLKAHCFVPTTARGAGEVGLRFRPLRVRRDFLDILGTIWLDSATYLARRLELEYVDGVESRGTVRVDFADVPVAGGTLRMPVGGTFAMRPSRKNPTKRTEGKFRYTYSGVEEVPRS
jgi:Ca-activated chloride channel family protein